MYFHYSSEDFVCYESQCSLLGEKTMISNKFKVHRLLLKTIMSTSQ